MSASSPESARRELDLGPAAELDSAVNAALGVGVVNGKPGNGVAVLGIVAVRSRMLLFRVARVDRLGVSAAGFRHVAGAFGNPPVFEPVCRRRVKRQGDRGRAREGDGIIASIENRNFMFNRAGTRDRGPSRNGLQTFVVRLVSIADRVVALRRVRVRPANVSRFAVDFRDGWQLSFQTTGRPVLGSKRPEPDDLGHALCDFEAECRVGGSNLGRGLCWLGGANRLGADGDGSRHCEFEQMKR